MLVPGTDLQTVERTLTALPAQGTVDLGDVIFEQAPLLARGIVVDDTGSPCALAVVFGEWDGSPRSSTMGTTTDEHGHFELRDLRVVGNLRLRAASRDQRVMLFSRGYDGSPPVAVHDPNEELRLVVARLGAIEGVLNAAPAEFAHGASVRLRRTGSAWEHTLEAKKLGDNRGFRFDDLPPDRYEIEVVLSKDGKHGETSAPR